MSISFLLLRPKPDHNFLLNSSASCIHRTNCFSFITNLSPSHPSPSRSQFLGPPFPQRYSSSPVSLINQKPNLDHSLSVLDHDRPLTKTGQADAAKVAQILSSLGWLPQLILSRSFIPKTSAFSSFIMVLEVKVIRFHSDATRTKETLKSMQAQVDGFMEANVHFIPSFYSIAAMDGQTADHLQHIISKYSSPDITTVMYVSLALHLLVFLVLCCCYHVAYLPTYLHRCMGHNKGWEEAASMLSGASVKLKTCNAALLLAFGNSWDDVCILFFFFLTCFF